ncbi:unnamed protein product [Meloidogyne enterolobii]|uniref:Uncharacterized protein n=1 Tax=Meloidogyne enterolobii TaxID=390850 RepID=A0ACB0Y6W6_MELEN
MCVQGTLLAIMTPEILETLNVVIAVQCCLILRLMTRIIRSLKRFRLHIVVVVV